MGFGAVVPDLPGEKVSPVTQLSLARRLMGGGLPTGFVVCGFGECTFPSRQPRPVCLALARVSCGGAGLFCALARSGGSSDIAVVDWDSSAVWRLVYRSTLMRLFRSWRGLRALFCRGLSTRRPSCLKRLGVRSSGLSRSRVGRCAEGWLPPASVDPVSLLESADRVLCCCVLLSTVLLTVVSTVLLTVLSMVRSGADLAVLLTLLWTVL